jgi:Raf kinase inhibitor-like YbhB/YbcL family protein
MRTLSLVLCASAIAGIAGDAHADGFTLESASFGSNATLATKYVYNQGDCKGGNVSPELHWIDAPEGTQSFAVTLYDPDARGGSGWWHWLVFDIDAKTTSLEPGAGSGMGSTTPPGSISGTNSFGDLGYSGPCPPRGDEPHRYVFTVYALRTEKLGLPQGADPDTIKQALEANTLLSASLQARYGR